MGVRVPWRFLGFRRLGEAYGATASKDSRKKLDNVIRMPAS